MAGPYQDNGVESKWLRFMEGPSDSGKTRIVLAYNKEVVLLGEIRWKGQWRQYAFYPEVETVFNEGCLDDIRSEIMRQMQLRKRQPTTN